jgi:hypothetical protein
MFENKPRRFNKEAELPKRRTSVSRQNRSIRSALSSIIGALDRLAPVLGAFGASGAGVAPRTRRRLRLSPARRAALKVQGQYMGYLRGLKPRQKATVKQLRATKGVKEAIKLARKLAGS